MNKRNGTFITKDLRGDTIVFEWEEIPGHTQRLTEKIKSLIEILVPAYAKTETDFALKKTDSVANDFMLKPLAYLLDQGVHNVDWQMFEEKTKALLKQFFTTMDWMEHSGVHDINIFVVAREQVTGKMLGVIQFLITPAFVQNDIKAALYGVIPSESIRGLEKLLMSAIFKLQPHVKRIFLHARSTNQQAIIAYESWGFVQCSGSLPNWSDLEYITEQCNVLQKAAQEIV